VTDWAHRNIQAFLTMLKRSEGTYGHGDDGYNVIVGGELFHGYADHPRVLVTLNNKGLKSTAAGAYQFLASTWDDLKRKLNLPDFSPKSQDIAAQELIRERHALADVADGRLAEAIAKCAPTWASLPGAGYDQPEHTMAQLRDWYEAAGGIVED